MKLSKWQSKYKKLSKKICGKCKPGESHCCYPGMPFPRFLLEKINAKSALEANEEGRCPAYNPHYRTCIIYNYRPEACRSYFCKNWESVFADKKKREIVIKGNFKEIDKDKLIKHIKHIYPKLYVNYLIVSENPHELAVKIAEHTGLEKIFFEEDASFEQISPFEDMLDNYQMIITNTSLDNFMKNEKDKYELAHKVLNKHLFIVK